MLRIESPLSVEFENLVQQVIGCCIRVHRELGPGLLESIYRRAVAIELNEADLPFEMERQFQVRYRTHVLCTQRVDIIVGGQLLLEIKAVDRLAPVHQAQVMSYLRLCGIRVALLVNFNVAILPDGLRRVIL
jgi:GxxExxY protein